MIRQRGSFWVVELYDKQAKRKFQVRPADYGVDTPASEEEAKAEIRGAGIGEDEAVQMEPLVRDWLAGEGGDKEKLKMKLISLGVTEPNVPLVQALAQIPTAKKASDLLAWMGQNNSMTAEQLADALIEEGVAVEKAA